MAARFHSTLSQGVADDREGSTGIMYAMLRDKVCDFVSFGTLNYRVGERKSSLNYRVGTKSKKMSTKG